MVQFHGIDDFLIVVYKVRGWLYEEETYIT